MLYQLRPNYGREEGRLFPRHFRSEEPQILSGADWSGASTSQRVAEQPGTIMAVQPNPPCPGVPTHHTLRASRFALSPIRGSLFRTTDQQQARIGRRVVVVGWWRRAWRGNDGGKSCGRAGNRGLGRVLV